MCMMQGHAWISVLEEQGSAWEDWPTDYCCRLDQKLD